MTVPSTGAEAVVQPSAAIILAGGRGSRMGGQDKPALLLEGRTLLQIACGAVGDAPTVVVGPARALPPGVLAVTENPPGGGPAAAVVTGLAALPGLDPNALIAVLAADLPGIEPDTITRLCVAAAPASSAVLVDPGGRRQYLTGVWRCSRLTAAAGVRPDWTGRPLRELLEPIPVREIAGSAAETADVDTQPDWERWRRKRP